MRDSIKLEFGNQVSNYLALVHTFSTLKHSLVYNRIPLVATRNFLMALEASDISRTINKPAMEKNKNVFAKGYESTMLCIDPL